MPSDGPKPGKRNVLVTSALPYVNNVPHLGNIVGSVLSGDVFARYCRLRDYETLHIAGTDEYGTATETKALLEKKSPKEICDEYHAVHADIYNWFNIYFDEFGRTTNEFQTPLAQEIITSLDKNNYLFNDEVEQLHCESCDRFLADRFVEGICPQCKYEDARGDQCDSCGKLINATDLKDPKCKLCRATPKIRKSKHYFFDLTKLQGKLETWYNDTKARAAPPPRPIQSSLTPGEGDPVSNAAETTSPATTIDSNSNEQQQQPQEMLTKHHTHWTNTAKAITESWLRDGLKPRCITRDMKWGTKVPLPDCENKVLYVWFDAPIGYLSITAKHTSEWRKWWKGEQAQELVEYFQFMAKDNVPFHSIMFPATLEATGEPWVRVKGLIATDYLNYENTKFSKSRGLGVFGDNAKETGIPADVWRFYLMYIRPEGQDSSFCWDDFRDKVNQELLNNVGNFINRAVSFVAKNFAGQLNVYEPNKEDLKYLNDVGQNLIAYEERLERVHLRDGVRIILAISRLGNQLIQANQPWKLIKQTEEDKKRAETVMYLALNTVALIALLLSPYMPEISKNIKRQLALECDFLVEMKPTMPLLIELGHQVGEPGILFQRIEADQVKEFKKLYGSQSGKLEESPKGAKLAKQPKQPKQAKQPKTSKPPEGATEGATNQVEGGK